MTSTTKSLSKQMRLNSNEEWEYHNYIKMKKIILKGKGVIRVEKLEV